MSFCDWERLFISILAGNDYLPSMFRKGLHPKRLQRWYASKEYNFQISFEMMRSSTKLRTIQPCVIFYYYSHLGDGMIKREVHHEHNR